MSDANNTVQTSVQQVDLDLDSWLGAPGAESIVTPAESKPNIFSKGTVDLGFLDKEERKDDQEEIKDQEHIKDKEGSVSRGTLDQIIEEADSEEETTGKGGRPRTEKSGLVEFLKKRIESKEMFAFDDYDESKQSLDDYLVSLGEKDVEELWKANIDNLKNEVAANTPQEFFESLPEKLQYAAKYVMDGGQDLEGLFQALAQSEQVARMNPADENDQESIVRSYLLANNFGSEEEIEEEVNTWKDLGVLEKKAKQFKPKLDQMQEQLVQAQLAEQEMRKEQQEQAAQAYQQNVFEALRAGELNGMKLDKKIQAQLYSGLVQPQYPSISGRPTNLLGHLLERYQFVDPNYPLIAEALWLLSDPDNYRDQLRRQGGNQKVEQTVRQLKTEQNRRMASTMEDDDDQPRTRKLTRPVNIFKR
jgi:hypothetical protein